jgi:GNAT superfamily N-acetyltransferase
MTYPTRPVSGGFPELSDAAAWRQRSAFNLAGFSEHSARARERRRQRWDDVWAGSGPYAGPDQNGATLLRPLDQGQVAHLLGRLDRFYARQPEMPWWLWNAWPSADLQLQGLEHVTRIPIMVRLPGAALPAPPPELRVVEAVDAATIADGERIMVDGGPIAVFQPLRAGSMLDTRILGGPLRMWVGYVNDRAIATATGFSDARVNGLYGVVTIPEGRGRGYGTALTARAIAAEPALPAVLTASTAGYGMYMRLGFTEVARYDLWVKPR